MGFGINNSATDSFTEVIQYDPNNSQIQPQVEPDIIDDSKEKHALLIGLNYQGTSHALTGCENDSDEMKRLLVNFLNYKDENIQVVRYPEMSDENNITYYIQEFVKGFQKILKLFFITLGMEQMAWIFQVMKKREEMNI
jgi:hypothetical protein